MTFRRGNWLEGRSGRDLLIGGQLFGQLNPDSVPARVDTRKNYLYGGAGEDIIVPGATAYDTNFSALEMIRNTWLGSGDGLNRARLLLPNPDGSASGPVFARDQTVFVNNVAPAPGPNGLRITTFEQSIVYGGLGEYDFVVAGYAAIIKDLEVGVFVSLNGHSRTPPFRASEGWDTFDKAFGRRLVTTVTL